MSSDLEEHSASETTLFTTTLSISLTTKIVMHPKGGSKAALKITKDMKTKETKFTISIDNYHDLLKLILSKHNEIMYKVTEWKAFSFKYRCPPLCK